MKTKVISAFPGCGKSTLKIKLELQGFNVLDSDSSQFHWIINDETNGKEKNPDFPNNYIDHIKDNICSVDYIFVSSDRYVLEALLKEGVEFVLFFPARKLKDEYLNRYTSRGNDTEFIEILNNKWDFFISDMFRMTAYTNYYVMKTGEFLEQALAQYERNSVLFKPLFSERLLITEIEKLTKDEELDPEHVLRTTAQRELVILRKLRTTIAESIGMTLDEFVEEMNDRSVYLLDETTYKNMMMANKQMDLIRDIVTM